MVCNDVAVASLSSDNVVHATEVEEVPTSLFSLTRPRLKVKLVQRRHIGRTTESETGMTFV